MKRFILIFLFIVCYAGYLIVTRLFFGDNNLVSIKGMRPSFVTTYVKTKERVTVAYLGFKFKEDQRMYTAAADITNLPDGERAFEGVALALKEAGQVEVLIQKGELSVTKPKVFLVRANEKEIFSLSKKKSANGDLFLFLLLLLLLFCSAYYWLRCLQIAEKKPIHKNKWAF